MCATELVDQAPQFLAWCKTQGILLSKCKVQRFEGTGRGIGASEDIQKGEVILHVPDDAVLMPSTCSVAKARAVLGMKSRYLDSLKCHHDMLSWQSRARPKSYRNWVAPAQVVMRRSSEKPD